MRLSLGILVIILGMSLMFFGCEGPKGDTGSQGSQGPTGPEGPEGPGYPTFTYLGDDGNTCAHCHASTVEMWDGTLHSEAYATLVDGGDQDDLFCLQCHTLGFDSPISEGDTSITVHGPDMTGFDDYWPPANAEDSARIAILKNVQCESCHGPMGPTIYNHEPMVSFATRAEGGVELSLCAKCHEQVTEWETSGHGTVLQRHEMTIEEFSEEFGRSSCYTCHTAEGFASNNDPALAGMAIPETVSQIGCPACHTPHDGTLDFQLRNLDDVTVLYDANEAATFTGKGSAQICAQCHHGRRDVASVEDQIENGNAHFGPHESPQMDEYVGSGCYEIDGYTYERSHSHQSIPQACVSCHMTDVSHGDFQPEVAGHDFMPSLTACQPCHPGLTSFDLNGFQSDVDDMLDELLTAIGVSSPDSLGSATATTPDQRKAGFAYAFVSADASHGVHNPAYTLSLLENAIDYANSLKGTKPTAMARR